MTSTEHCLDCGKGALMLYLDLSAAFDTLNLEQLLKTLETRFGVQGSALSWIRSYLTGRTQRIRINNTESSETTLRHGVPQGSVLGPVLFSIYTTPLCDIMQQHQVRYHRYADDMVLYDEFDPAVPADLARTKSRLTACFRDVRRWLLTNSLQVNDRRLSTCVLCLRITWQPVVGRPWYWEISRWHHLM